MPSAATVVATSALPRHEAERLLMSAAKLSRSQLVVIGEVDDAALQGFRSLEARRLAGEPLQYLEGEVPFGSVSITVDPRVLIPRPETEELLELAIGLVESPERIVDLCTGSGNLAVALAARFPVAEVHATDISADAVDVARDNAERNGVTVELGVGDLFDPLPERLEGRVDLIVANPPYLADSELDGLSTDVLREPHGALVAGPTGLEVVARIANAAPAWLAPGGVIACEVSEFHGAAAVDLFEDMGAQLVTDMFGKDRFVIGRLPFE
jgi:release factor glutamine methyltransferase